MNWTDTLMLGILSDSEAVGHLRCRNAYGASDRLHHGCRCVSVIASRFAVLYAHGEIRALESLMRTPSHWNNDVAQYHPSCCC